MRHFQKLKFLICKRADHSSLYIDYANIFSIKSVAPNVAPTATLRKRSATPCVLQRQKVIVAFKFIVERQLYHDAAWVHRLANALAKRDPFPAPADQQQII